MGRMTDRKNDKRRNVGRRLLSCMLAFCLFISAFYGIVFFKIVPKVAQAADEPEIKILVDKTEYSDANPYKLKSKTVILKLDDASAAAYQTGDYKVTWDVMTGTENIKIDSYSRTDATVKALKYGEGAVVRVVVEKTSGSFYRVAYCGVDVVFGIDTPVSDFGLIDGKRALFLKINGQKTLQLGLGGTATWTGSDSDVITVNRTTGLVSAMGAGVATVYARGTGEGEEDSIKVYCAPGVAKNDGDAYTTSLSCEIDNGGYIYTNTKFQNAPAGLFNDKIYWEVINEQGQVVVKTGAGEAADGSLTVKNATGVFDNRLQINGLAGKYTMYLYITGTKAAHDEDKSLYDVATVSFTIRSNIKDDKKILGINDKYNLYEAFNITKSDFTKFFGTPTIWMDTNEDDPGQYSVPVDEKYATLDKTNYVVTAKKEADIVARMTVSQSTSVREELQRLTGLTKVPDYFVIKFSIADRITLSSDSLEMMKGTEQVLHVTKSSSYNGPISWSSSDPGKVSVEGNGLDGRITAKEISPYPGVTITATMDIGNGLYRVAYCQITVIDALSDFDLDHTSKLTLHVGQQEPVRVKVNGDIGTAELPLMWSQSTDKEIIGIDVQDGNDWAWIEGKEGGTTTLMVTNVLDGTVKRLDIEVVIAVESLKFKQDAYTYPFYTSGKRMSTELEVKPNDATASEIAWSVDKESVAKVDQNGYLSFVNPGTVTLTAKVKN
ncbi:MAG: Ig-like domain-containing protein, partial [Eubacterium sp.]|nr:Ig-like domain-containing protein [Eubacterium sp.]